MTEKFVRNPITGELVPDGRSDLDPLSNFSLPRYNYPYPISPKNIKVLHSFEYGTFDITWDEPAMDPRNSEHQIDGLNIYRSIDSSEGPWIKANTDILRVNFFRDQSENILVENELVNNSLNLHLNEKTITIQTKNYPLVTGDVDNHYEYNPDSLIVFIDGTQIRVKAIKPLAGEIELFMEKEYDPVFNRYFDLKLPNINSEIRLSYKYNNLFLQKEYDVDQRIFYKITTVSTEGLETPLDRAHQASYQDLEGITYIWANIISKQTFLLDQGGERAWLFIQRSSGTPCTEHDSVTESLYGEVKTLNCEKCFGTGFLGGFIGPYEVQLAPFDAEVSHRFSNKGRIVSKNNESFLTNYPVVRQGDLIVRRNGERYIIGPVKRKEPNGVLVQQNFTLHMLQPRDIRYRIGLNKKPEFDAPYQDNIKEDKRYLETSGKTPRFRNIHKLPEEG